MKKISEVIEFIWCWTYFFVVVLLRLFRLISQKRFHELLFGGSDGFENEDINVFKKKPSSKS